MDMEVARKGLKDNIERENSTERNMGLGRLMLKYWPVNLASIILGGVLENSLYRAWERQDQIQSIRTGFQTTVETLAWNNPDSLIYTGIGAACGLMLGMFASMAGESQTEMRGQR